MHYPLLIQPMGGLGDTVYQRPFVRLHAAQREVFVRTPWPELFEDVPNVRFVYPHGMDLRTQSKNAALQDDDLWSAPPLKAERIRAMYTLRDRRDTVISELARGLGIGKRGALPFDLPNYGTSPVRYKRYAVLRPVTLRKEWRNAARAPEPAYLHRAAEILKDLGYSVVTVGDVDGKGEWFEGEPPPADKELLRGELPLRKLLALVQGADLVVGGVGFIVPVGMASMIPTVVIGGGNGAHNSPDVLTDPRVDSSTLRWILPDEYCRCADRRHECPKKITGFDTQFLEAVADLEAAREAA